jgi:hypothetical protein
MDDVGRSELGKDGGKAGTVGAGGYESTSSATKARQEWELVE